MDPVELRHILHMNPELAFQEFDTSNLIEKNLRSFDLEIERIAKTGIIVIFRNSGMASPFTLFRSELDALPVREMTGWKYESKNGKMHACGHDVHMAILYGLILKVIEKGLKSNLLFLFQPAEETNQGAKICLEEIKKMGFRIKNAVALHVTDEYAFGEVATRRGVLFSSSIEVDCSFKGQAIHIAFKEKGKDAMKGMMRFLERVEKSDWKDGLVGFGALRCGSVRNVVADECVAYGTLRAGSFEKNLENLRILEKIGMDVAREFGMEFDLRTGAMTPELIVDDTMYELLKDVVESMNLRFIEANIKFTSEDFAFFTREYPSLMFWLGVFKGGERVGLHSPKFLPSDDVIDLGIDLMFNIALKMVEGK